LLQMNRSLLPWKAKAKAKMWIMGVPFRPMVESDFDAFAGATEECLIGFPSDDVVLIYDPSSNEINEIWNDNDGEDFRIWKQVL